ncbi:MAG: CvpA family protein [Bacillota bacterium]
MQSLNVLDLILILFFLLFIINGYKNGFIEQISVILGIVISFYFAIRFYPEMEVLLVPYFDIPERLLEFISFSLIFIILNILIHLLAEGIKNILDLLFLKSLDQLMGAFLGLIKGILILYLLILFINQIPYTKVRNLVDNSIIAKNFLEMNPKIQNSLENFFKKP